MDQVSRVFLKHNHYRWLSESNAHSNKSLLILDVYGERGILSGLKAVEQ